MRYLTILFSAICVSITAIGGAQGDLDLDLPSIEFKPESAYTAGSVYRVILDPRHKTTISAQVPAAVIEINKRIGDSFEEGETIMKLDDRIFAAKLKEAEAMHQRAKDLVETQQRLYDDDIASLTELREAQAALAAAESDIAISQKSIEDCTIVGPYNGKVVDIFIEKHELAEIADEILEIVADKVLIAKLLILSKDLQKISIGDTLTIKLDDNGKTVEAEIARIGAVIDPASSTIEIQADIDNSDGSLKAGMSGVATLK